MKPGDLVIVTESWGEGLKLIGSVVRIRSYSPLLHRGVVYNYTVDSIEFGFSGSHVNAIPVTPLLKELL